jgi:hypothetical protein
MLSVPCDCPGKYEGEILLTSFRFSLGLFRLWFYEGEILIRTKD